jgi:ribonuclease P protein subunit RPR2
MRVHPPAGRRPADHGSATSRPRGGSLPGAGSGFGSAPFETVAPFQPCAVARSRGEPAGHSPVPLSHLRGPDGPAPQRQVLCPVRDVDLSAGGVLSRMPTTAGPVRRGGRRGRRTSLMVRIARERIADLFALAEREAEHPASRLADRYVRLARRIGTRYNVRLPAVYRELYCRGCSSYWVEGRTVRTRLRGARRVRTCLACGRTRRVPLGRSGRAAAPPEGFSSPSARDDEVLVGPLGEEDEEGGDEDGSEGR